MRTLMLLISVVMGMLPLAGVGKILLDGEVRMLGATMDGLFMSLILLAMSGIFFLNAFWEMRDAGWPGFLGRGKSGINKVK
ncbi:MAG: hypothetical protein ACRD24_10365 [Terriglobales bacterium]